MYYKQGITLVELLIVVVVMGILSSVLILTFNTTSGKAQLEQASESVLSLLEKAKVRTLGSENASQYGVHFEINRAVFFEGATYNAMDPANVVFLIPDRVSIITISLNGGGPDVVFDRLTGDTAQHGSIILELKTDSTKQRAININETGAIYLLN